MKYLLMCSACLVFFVTCKKNDINTIQNSSSICFKTSIINTNITENFLSVFFINGKDGFITGDNGGIYKTTDSAKSWTALNSTTSLPIRDIYFLDSNKGFAAGGKNTCEGTGCISPGGFILETQNSGQSWTKILAPTGKIELSSICFINSTTGFCAGDNAVFNTNDGGKTWTENKLNNIGGKMMKISFIDNQNGFIACLFDKILKTTNGGLTWEITSPNKNVGYYSLSSSEGVSYVSGQGKILKTLNNGTNWTELTNSPVDIYAIYFTDKNIGYAFGRGNYSGGDFEHSYGSIYCTSNGGNTWNGKGDFKDVGLIKAVSFPTKNIAYAISGNKIIKISTI